MLRKASAILIVIACVGCSDESAGTGSPPAAPDFDAAWNYNDPEATRRAFREMLAGNEAAPHDWRLELMTQIARTHSLVGEFDQAHAILDQVAAELDGAADRIRLRYLLERGRTLNSAGEQAAAKPLFVEAWRIGRDSGDDTLAVDAAHMVAIAVTGTAEAEAWNLKGLALARASDDESARNWVGALTYNLGWEAFEAGHPDQALALFEESRVHYEKRNLPERERVSRWSVARAKRELGTVDEALAMQLALKAEHEAAGTDDPFVHEELGELYLIKGERELALESFAKALPLLEKERWLVESEPERLTRIREMLKAR
jgi:tetratricopeptide (TPR) repeat protein